MSNLPKELKPDDLRWRCDPEAVRLRDGEEAGPFETVIGQDRAIAALRLGLELYARGYNLFVCGISGTGKTSTVKQILEGISPKCALPPDRVYVHNFREPHRPSLITLARAKAREFRGDLSDLARRLSKAVPALFESPEYLARRKEILDRHEVRERDLYKTFEERIHTERFAMVQIQVGPIVKPDIFYLVEEKALPLPKVRELVEAGKLKGADPDALEHRYEALTEELTGLLRQGRTIAREMESEVREFDRKQALGLIRGHFDDLRERWEDPAARRFLEGLQAHVLDRLEVFRSPGEEEDEKEDRRKTAALRAFEVNVVADNAGREGCPVEIENHPSYTNLFGTIEFSAGRGGAPRADHLGIRPGSLLAADGGYLVVNALDVFLQPGAWPALKRTLKAGLLEIQPLESFFQFGPIALKPEPIPINVKVVMIGEASLYHLLWALDEDFGKIFKVKADFDSEMEKTEANVRLYAAFTARQSARETLRPFEPAAVARLVEHGVRKAGRRDRLSTRFGPLADVLREANYWAGAEGAERVGRPHVERAIREQMRRESLPEEKIRELIRKGILLIDTDGERVGVVNGLAVYDFGPYAFGKPSRITAAVGVGRAGIINIEREANLSGATHDKGVLILAGFLRERFALDKPLALSASICFEQSYGGIDGDSASSTEIYALLSALSGVPIRQGMAVTGSVNQKGEVQPIGGVNEKVEGFYEVCRVMELTGRQGVLIPRRNVEDLMLKDEVVEAVAEGRFHLHPVDTVDEGIEFLTGVAAGARNSKGRFPEGSINARVDARLAEFAESLRRFEAAPRGNGARS